MAMGRDSGRINLDPDSTQTEIGSGSGRGPDGFHCNHVNALLVFDASVSATSPLSFPIVKTGPSLKLSSSFHHEIEIKERKEIKGGDCGLGSSAATFEFDLLRIDYWVAW
ncbi:hypothetical protein Drorol1_Dr00020918 [Drosera rotundifolia]